MQVIGQFSPPLQHQHNIHARTWCTSIHKPSPSSPESHTYPLLSRLREHRRFGQSFQLLPKSPPRSLSHYLFVGSSKTRVCHLPRRPLLAPVCPILFPISHWCCGKGLPFCANRYFASIPWCPFPYHLCSGRLLSAPCRLVVTFPPGKIFSSRGKKRGGCHRASFRQIVSLYAPGVLRNPKCLVPLHWRPKSRRSPAQEKPPPSRTRQSAARALAQPPVISDQDKDKE